MNLESAKKEHALHRDAAVLEVVKLNGKHAIPTEKIKVI